MAQIDISIRRDNGTVISATASVDDTYVADMAMTLTALLFDSASTAPTPAAPTPQPVQLSPTPEELRPVPPAPGQSRN